MTSINHSVVRNRLTAERLKSYLSSVGGDLEEAIRLYDWNVRAGGAFHEDLGRVEILLRNAVDTVLVAYGSSQGWPTVWYRRMELFSGRQGARAWEEIATARRRATKRGRVETHGRVIAELNLGFWRYLCTRSYLTSLWVPALTRAFPNHPGGGNPRLVRGDVEERIERLRFLRNRIAHHEPIHQRNPQRDLAYVFELSGWICLESRAWITRESRTGSVLAGRP